MYNVSWNGMFIPDLFEVHKLKMSEMTPNKVLFCLFVKTSHDRVVAWNYKQDPGITASIQNYKQYLGIMVSSWDVWAATGHYGLYLKIVCNIHKLQKLWAVIWELQEIAGNGGQYSGIMGSKLECG